MRGVDIEFSMLRRGRAMTRPEPTGETEGKIEAGVQEKDDFDEASDFCDFGYVLASGAGPGPAPTTQRRRDGSA